MKWLIQIRANCMERSLAAIDRIAARRGHRHDLPAHLITGIEGEDAAYFHLLRKGYQVVARRWSSGNLPGDVDLIAWHDTLLCFVEVKTRTSRDATPAEAAVDNHKRAILRRLASRYVRQLPQETAPQIRFDVISVYLIAGGKDCVHFENAFGWNERRQDWD